MSPFITIARIVKTRGIRGELVAEILTDFPERFESLSRVYLAGPDRWEVLEDHWFHKGRVILKFSGRDRPHEADELIGAEVQAEAGDRKDLPEGTYFDSDLIGCHVFEEDRELGVVEDIFKAAGELVNLVLATPGGGEVMVPLVEEFIRDVDLEGARIEVALPSGLLDLETRRSTQTKKK